MNKKEEDFNQTYQRFQSQLQDYEIKMEILREEKQEAELKGVTYTPRLNKNSMNMVKGKKSFLERQASFEKKKQAKAQKLLEEKKKKEDEILKKSRNTKIQNKDINNFLTHCAEWENKKKEKITKMLKEKEQKEILCKTSSNKKSKQNDSNLQNTLERLYKDDVLKRKQNQSVLTSIFTPSFTPRINKTKNSLNKTNDNINLTESSIDLSNQLDISMEQLKIQNNEKVNNALRNKLFKAKPRLHSNFLNKTCTTIITPRKDDESSTAPNSKKKIKVIK